MRGLASRVPRRVFFTQLFITWIMRAHVNVNMFFVGMLDCMYIDAVVLPSIGYLYRANHAIVGDNDAADAAGRRQ